MLVLYYGGRIATDFNIQEFGFMKPPKMLMSEIIQKHILSPTLPLLIWPIFNICVRKNID